MDLKRKSARPGSFPDRTLGEGPVRPDKGGDEAERRYSVRGISAIPDRTMASTPAVTAGSASIRNSGEW